MTDAKEPVVNRRLCRPAFSLIEILVVIGLITLLSSLLIIGIGRLQTSAKKQQTQLAFQNLQAMYAEYDAVARPHIGRSATPCPGSVVVGASDRTGDVVYATRDMIAMLKTMPVNAAALGKLSAASVMTLPAESVAAWSASPTPPHYVVGDHVQTTGMDQFGNTVTYYFVCIQGGGTVSPPDPTHWMSSTSDLTVPVLLDGWGNPIIFVPGGTLGFIPGGAYTSGFMTTSGNVITISSPDHRPFWASAGPGGNFSNADGNLYSFEK